MNQLMLRALTSLLTVVLWTAGAAYAQTPAVIKVNIPFEFRLGDQSFPPGDYSLVQPLQHLLVLRDARRQTIASTFTTGIESSAAPAISKLKFRSVGGQYVLTEVWQQDDRAGLKLFPTNTTNRSYVAKRRSPEARHTAEGSQP
jgi:hypothetical protein